MSTGSAGAWELVSPPVVNDTSWRKRGANAGTGPMGADVAVDRVTNISLVSSRRWRTDRGTPTRRSRRRVQWPATMRVGGPGRVAPPHRRVRRGGHHGPLPAGP